MTASWAPSLRSVSYGAVMFASSALNNVFVTYYLATFTGGALSLTPTYFYAGQTAFL
jgi:hypothetical protein